MDKKNNGIKWAVFALIVVGVFLRVNRYGQGFPLWGDEAWVAWYAYKRTFSELICSPSLAIGIPTPPLGFMLMEKALMTFVSTSELALRFWPCLCSVASLFLFRRLLRSTVSPVAGLIAMAFLVFSPSAILYASELKQYSSDLMFVIAIYIVHWKAVKSGMDWKPVLRLTEIGLIGLLFSLPLVIVLGGIALTQVASFWRQGHLRPLCRYALVGGNWLLGFYFLWDISYHSNYNNPQVLRYQIPYYLSIPGGAEAWAIWWHKLLGVFNDPAGLAWPALSGGLFLTGCYVTWRQRRELFWVLIVPLLLTVLLSMGNKYPFHGRFLLFLLPALYILIAQGAAYLLQTGRVAIVVCYLVLGLLFWGEMGHAKDFIAPRATTDIRSLMVYLKANAKAGDGIYFSNDTQWGYFFYRNILSVAPLREEGILYEFESRNVQPGQQFFLLTTAQPRRWRRVFRWDVVLDPREGVIRMPGKGRTWILLSQLPEGKEQLFMGCFDAFARRLDERHGLRSSLYLYDLP